MKLNTDSFPYPVLVSQGGSGTDYVNSKFQCNLEFADQVNENLTIEIRHDIELSNNEIESLIKKKQARYAIEINCPDTLKREIVFLGASGTIKPDASELYGRVDFTPMVVVTKVVKGYSSEDLNAEYDGASFTLNAGDIVAVDTTWTKYIEFDNLSFDSLIKVDTDPDLGVLEYRIDLTPSFICIWMGMDMRELWSEMKQDKQFKPTLAMSIYKDVVFLAIENLVDDPECEDFRWARSLRSSIEELGYSLPEEYDFNQINILAQNLVQEIGAGKLLNSIRN